jgi:outer membrane receptor protein involved in Fe transport
VLRRAAALGLLVPGLALAQSAPDAPAAPEATLPAVSITGAAPLLGSGGDANTVPAASQALTRQDVVRTGISSALGALDEKVGGIALDEAAGNPFQPNLLYRGFTASPLPGSTQGLAVYLNGTRFNQPFGDTVDWDLIPAEAVARINVEGANPVFGLNALGGSISVQLRDGFSFHGGDARLNGGSFGRIGSELQYGAQSGSVAAYVAASIIHADGWRQDQGSEVRRIYGDVGWHGPDAQAHLGILLADNHLSGPGTVPVELLAADRSAAFTSPNLTVNKYVRLSLTGTYDVNAATQIQAAAYYVNFAQRVVNGNTPTGQSCPDGSGLLCSDNGGYLTGRDGAPIPDVLAGGPYSEMDLEGITTNGYGASAQATHTGAILGRGNRVLAGASVDDGVTLYDATPIIGGLTPDRAFLAPGITIAQSDLSIAPVRLSITNTYYGLYASDTLDLAPRLTLTLSGRLNVAQINLTDDLGGPISGNHTYAHLNPGIGLTYTLARWATAYAGYSEANRAPTPAELSCADPASPCTLANFFVGDPALKQVVAHTWEAGLRGTLHPAGGGTLTWHAGGFRTQSDDDIVFVASVIPGRDYFQNVGTTLRQGLEAGIALRRGRLNAWLDYAYTEATFQSALTLDSPLNSGADANGQIRVRPGNRLPGVPLNRLKFGADYGVTSAWTLGISGIASSGQVLFGDEANLQPRTNPYVVLNLDTRYRIAPGIEVFGLVQNLLDAKYETYGTFSQTSAVPIAQLPGASNTRSLSPAAPVAGYGGVHVAF